MESFEDWYFELFENGNGSSLNQQEIAEEAWDFRQTEIDGLRKRIDDAIYDLQHIESAMWEEQVEHVLMILKGDQS